MKNLLLILGLFLVVSCTTTVQGPSVTNKFEQQIDAFKTFTTGFYNEDIDQLH